MEKTGRMRQTENNKGTAGDSTAQSSKHYVVYTKGEEIANSLTHGLGVVLAIVALVFLIIFALKGGGGTPKLVSAIIFGSGLILEYLASTLYHAIKPSKLKRIFRVIDHSCIYILIAASYAPFVLVTLLPYGGPVLYVVICAVALAGIIVEAFWRDKPKWINALIYILLGWACLSKLPTLIEQLPVGGFVLLAAGGVVYTLGTIFYLMKRVRYMHSIWHLFVLGGSICHFLAVLLYVY